MSTMFWIWMAAAVVFLILEIAMPGMIFVCFVAAAGATGIYAHFYPDAYYWQIGIFVGVSLVLLPLMRRFARRITKEAPVKSNVDALIGQAALVVKEIDSDLGGQVRVGGEIWIAQADDKIDVDSKVRITAVSGARLHVEKID